MSRRFTIWLWSAAYPTALRSSISITTSLGSRLSVTSPRSAGGSPPRSRTMLLCAPVTLRASSVICRIVRLRSKRERRRSWTDIRDSRLTIVRCSSSESSTPRASLRSWKEGPSSDLTSPRKSQSRQLVC